MHVKMGGRREVVHLEGYGEIGKALVVCMISVHQSI